MNVERIKHGVSNKIFRAVNARKGWRTSRKIIVIESDDWGSIRMPDRATYERLLKAGIKVDRSHYNKFDSLARNEDISELFQILVKHEDRKGNHPVITANAIVANPDFGKIRENQFQEYYYEPFTETLERMDIDILLWQEGLQNGLFFPQFHGREHLNIKRWMTYLQSGSDEVHFAFDNRLFGIGPKSSRENNPGFVQAFDSNKYLESHTLNNIINDGLDIFFNTFGYRSKSFIAPNYIWNSEVEKSLFDRNVKYIQGSFVQKQPDGKRLYNYLGKQNKYKQTYLIRNVVFEPSSDPDRDWISTCLREIDNAFKLGKPAVICMHRVNFIGSIFESNRTTNLMLFDKLLSLILEKWEEVEFMNSVELGDAIENISVQPFSQSI